MLNNLPIKTIRPSMVFFLLALAFVSLVVGNDDSLQDSIGPEITIEALCASKPLKLTKISQVLTLIESLKAQQSKLKSCEAYVKSILSLEDILVTVQSGKTCDLEFVDKLRKYHNSFIGVDRSYDRLKSIPKPLKRFFIGLGFQINADCKKSLINNLENDIKGRLPDRTYEIIGYVVESDATSPDNSGEMKDFDDIPRMKDFDDECGNNDAQILIKMKTDIFVKTIQETCQNKFKPIYSKLILPVIELSNLGYNYQGELISRELEELRRNKFVQRWYNIVQTCESYEAMELYYDTSTKVYRKSQVITFISRQEADKLDSLGMRMIPKLSNEGLIDYKPDLQHTSDELWILQQEGIEKLISNHKATVTEGETIRGRCLGRFFGRLTTALKSGSLLAFIKSQFKKDDSPTVIDDIGTIKISKSDKTVENPLNMVKKEAVKDGEAIVGADNKLTIVSTS